MAKDIAYTAKVTIEGLTPLLMHKMSVAALNMQKTTKKNVETNYGDEWKRTAYLNNDGQLVCPSMNIEAMLMRASIGQKIGKNSIAKFMPQVNVQELDPVITVNGSAITLDQVAENGWIDVRSVVVNKNRIARSRVCLPVGWVISFTLVVKTTILSADILKSLLDDGGELVGLMDNRPEKRGKYGQFEVTRFIEK